MKKPNEFILIESVAISIDFHRQVHEEGGNSKEAEKLIDIPKKFELTKGCVSFQKDKGVDE
jgi:hypothetical protein